MIVLANAFKAIGLFPHKTPLVYDDRNNTKTQHITKVNGNEVIFLSLVANGNMCVYDSDEK